MADLPPALGPPAEKLKQIKKKRIPKRRTLLPGEFDPPTESPTASAAEGTPPQAMGSRSTSMKADKSVPVTDEEQPAKDPAVESSVASKPTFAMAAGRSNIQRGSPRPRMTSARPTYGSRGANARRASYTPRMIHAVRPNTPRVPPPPPPVLPDEDSDWEVDKVI